MSSKLHVAIVGGGITGVMLAIGLHARNVSCTIYERASGFSETGAGIGISPTAEAAMQLIDPAVHAAFQAAVTPNGEDYFQWIDGHTTDSVIYRLPLGKDGFQGGRRSQLLHCWAALIPPDLVQFRKELVGLNDSGTTVTLQFGDGTTATADAVIGCDGVWSRTRSLVFGDAYRATYSHQYCFRAVVPMADARVALGNQRSSTRFMFKGAMLNILVVVSDPNPWPETSSEVDGGIVKEASPASSATSRGNREDAERAFSSWQKCSRAVVSLLPSKPDRWAIFDLMEHPLPTYARGRIAVAGDAAHAAGPHLGAGAGFGIEDALVLAELLAGIARDNHTTTNTSAFPARITAALSAYSDMRYDRTQWLVRHTRDAVDLFQWRDESAGQDTELFQREITWRFHHIWNNDASAMVTQAQDTYDERLKQSLLSKSE
ncbi:protein toxd [Grosmannia clavigera kw1407]|uniref:Protein toxd n=1 Tax=Grosmannia clavigera (strain kw1407 / UAMH 11150) TaxID=655863 RepID=F0XJI3_GROCL|nr:protein toxd [Grosmannia clavigera kw1407]EFX02086.1 protein toxd [Grosmannia clavigera kw1407]